MSSIVNKPYYAPVSTGGTVNFPTVWDPSSAVNVTLSEGNLRTVDEDDWSFVRTIASKSSGKWYWEVAYDFGYVTIGIADATHPGIGTPIGSDTTSVGLFTNGAVGSQVLYNNSPISGPIDVTPGTVLGIALDMDTRTMIFENGTTTEVVMIPVGPIVGPVFPALADNNSSFARQYSAKTNFGQDPFVHTVPVGFADGFGDL